MDDGGVDYLKLSLRAFPARELRETSEGRYWRAFRTPLTANHVGGVSAVDFCAERPHHLAATSSTRVTLYDGITCGVKRTITRFADKAYCGRFRADGKLLAAGGESGIVQVFDASSRSLLRQLRGHRRPVHAVSFGSDKLHVLSGGDDAAVRLWDITSGAQLCQLQGHADYVRSAVANPASADVWATGSYDHTCKLWDVRQQCVLASVDHGAPVESSTFLPSGAVLITAGGNYLRCWDLYRGGALLQQVDCHQKTITSVTIAPGAQFGSARLLTASLDGHVKVHDSSSFQLVHASKYPAPILSLAVSADGAKIAVGMADGLLSIRQRRDRAPEPSLLLSGGRRRRYAPRLTAAGYRYFIRGQGAKAAAGDYVIAARRKAALPSYDRLLRRFRYREALDAALATRRPEVFATVVDELAARGGLATALSGRDAEAVLPLLEHLHSHIADPRFTPALSAVCHRVLDMYGGIPGNEGSAGGALVARLALLRERVHLEVRVQDQLACIKGMLEPLLSAAAL